MSIKTFLIALGGNIPTSEGKPEQTLRKGLESLARREMSITSVSRFYATPCFPKGAGPDYVNATAAITSALSPWDLMHILHDVEAEFGRARVQRWGQRTLDLDLLAADEAIVPDLETYETWRSLPVTDQMQHAPDALVLPHPRMQERAFVLVPLAEIAPDWQHPVLKLSVRDMLAKLPAEEVAEVVPL